MASGSREPVASRVSAAVAVDVSRPDELGCVLVPLVPTAGCSAGGLASFVAAVCRLQAATSSVSAAAAVCIAIRHLHEVIRPSSHPYISAGDSGQTSARRVRQHGATVVPRGGTPFP